MTRAALVAISLALVAPIPPSTARADEQGRVLDSLAELHRACERAEAPGRRQLYAVDLPARTWRFAAYDDVGGYLPVDTRRNLRALGGAARLMPSHLEPMGFVGSERRASALRQAAEAGATLRVGFFLGFDDPNRTLCLIRPAVGVTTVRMDVAYVELLGSDGRVLAREGGDRLRAWLDDEEDAIPGSGPRGAMGEPSVASGAPPASWIQAVAGANDGSVGEAIDRCHAAGVARGGAGNGQVVVRLVVDRASGVVRDSSVELSDIGDREEDACLARALAALRLPPAGEGTAQLSVPVRLRD